MIKFCVSYARADPRKGRPYDQWGAVVPVVTSGGPLAGKPEAFRRSY